MKTLGQCTQPTGGDQLEAPSLLHEEIPEILEALDQDSENIVHEQEYSANEEKNEMALSSADSTEIDEELHQQPEPQQQQEQVEAASSTRQAHSLRRQMPRLVVKQTPNELKIINATNEHSVTIVKSNYTTGSRACPSRRIQQQQEAKAAAASAAATSTAHAQMPSQTLGNNPKASTMMEVLASIPGFPVKPVRRRTNKKMSPAAQIEQTKDGKIDLETPDSILTATNLRALLNKDTFCMLPPLYQYNLAQLLPSVDQEGLELIDPSQLSAETVEPSPSGVIRLSSSCLANEFFSRACIEWQQRLAEGEFTSENQMKLKTEAEREKTKLDPWKLKQFEHYWGERSLSRIQSSEKLKNNIMPYTKSYPCTKEAAELQSCSVEEREGLKITVDKNNSVNVYDKPVLANVTSENLSHLHKETICDKQSELISGKSEAGNDKQSEFSASQEAPNNSLYASQAFRVGKRASSSPTSDECMDVSATKQSKQSKTVVVIEDNNIRRTSSEQFVVTEAIGQLSENSLVVVSPTNQSYENGVPPRDSSCSNPSSSSQSTTLTSVTEISTEYDNNNSHDSIQLPLVTVVPSATTATVTSMANLHFLPLPTSSLVPMLECQATMEEKLAEAESYVLQSIELKTDTCNDDGSIFDASVSNSPSSKGIPDNVDFLHSIESASSENRNFKENFQDRTLISTEGISKKAVTPSSTLLPLAICSVSSTVTSATSDTSIATLAGSSSFSRMQTVMTKAASLSKVKQDQLRLLEQNPIINNQADMPIELNHSDIFNHVQHDWNFGNIKLMQPTAMHSYASNKVHLSHSENKSLQTNSKTGGKQDMSIDIEHILEVVPVDNDTNGSSDNASIMECLAAGGGRLQHPDIFENNIVVENQMDDNCIVNNIVQELHQQSQDQIELNKQHQQHMQLEPRSQGKVNTFFQQEMAANEYSNEIAVSDDIGIEVPLISAEMEVTSTVVTNSSNSNDSSNELQLCNSNPAPTSVSTIDHLQQQIMAQDMPQTTLQTQHQVLVDSNGQIIGNFVLQPQQPTHQHTLLQQLHNMHPDQQQTQFPIAQSDPSKLQPTVQVTIRKPFEVSGNIRQQFIPSNVVSQKPQQTHFEQQEQQRKHFPLQPNQQRPLNTQTSHQSPNTIGVISQQQPSLKFQPQRQSQNLATFSIQQQQKCIPKTINVVSMAHPNSLTAATSTITACIPAISNISTSTLPSISNQLPNRIILNGSNNQVTSKLTPSGVPSTIAQQRLQNKLPSGKGRKSSNNKLPPGAVNLQRSYQICQAVIQSSPNRENLKAQLRPPPELLNKQIQQQRSSSSSSSSSNSSSPSLASNSPTLPSSGLANSIPGGTTSSPITIIPDDIQINNPLHPAIPPNLLGVGRPGVYKIVGPRMGFPRKKYVQRKPSPTLIRQVFTTQSSGVIPSSALAQGQQLQIPRMPSTSISAATIKDHEIHQNNIGQYVLIHRANVGAAENQAPRASSAPPLHQNPNHHIHAMNGIAQTMRGRPASVDIDSSHTLHENVQPNLVNLNAINNIRHHIARPAVAYAENTENTSFRPSYASDTVSQSLPDAAHPIKNFENSSENSNSSASDTVNGCPCSLKAMIICQRCGDLYHDDCIGPSNLCVACVIR